MNPMSMKKNVFYTIALILTVIVISCGGKESYYEQFTNDKSCTDRISSLNKHIDEIRAVEKGKLIKDDVTLLKYVYDIGKNDTYIVSYLFDEKGCWEVGIDSYFEKAEDAQSLVNGIKAEISSSVYGNPIEDNNLCRWKNPNGLASIELDYANTARGIVIITIMADE